MRYGIEDDFDNIAWEGTLEAMQARMRSIARDYEEGRWRVMSSGDWRELDCRSGNKRHTWKIVEVGD